MQRKLDSIIVAMSTTFAEERTISFVPRPTELPLPDAAEFLCVSERYLAELLDSGEVDSRHVGGRRMVDLKDVLDYKERKKNLRLAVLAELVKESQETGAY